MKPKTNLHMRKNGRAIADDLPDESVISVVLPVKQLYTLDDELRGLLSTKVSKRTTVQ